MWSEVNLREAVEALVQLVGEKQIHTKPHKALQADFLNAVYFGRGLTCSLGLTKDLIDSD